MRTAFDVELTDTLRELADEMGPGPANLAATALRDGRQIRRRRSVIAAVTLVTALAAAAAPAVVVTRHMHGTASAPSRQSTVDIDVVMPTGDRTQASMQLRKRFVDAGFTVLSTKLQATSDIQFRLGSALPRDRMETALQQLTGPGIMEFRTVLDTTLMPTLTTDQLDAATRQPATPPTLATVKAKLGAAYTVAASLTGPTDLDASTRAQLAPFATLTWSEVAVLPARIQFNVPTINCAQIVDPETTPPTAAPAAEQIVTCDQGSGPRSKYLLSAAQLTNTDIASATPINDQVHGWQMTVAFTASGQQRWTDLTNRLNAPANQANSVHKQLAIVVDGTMLTVTEIPSPVRGSVTITPTNPHLTMASANALAIVINNGPLPTRETAVVFVVHPGH